MQNQLVAPNVEPGNPSTWWTPRLAWPVLAAAVVRLGLLAVSLLRFGPKILFMSDTAGYFEPGRNLLLHGRFFAYGAPDVIRTPGYPLFLAATSLAGLDAAAVVNVMVSVFSVVLVWRIAQTAFGDDRVALGAAWLFAFEPMSILYACVLMSDTLFGALCLLSLERLATFLRGRSLGVLAGGGLWLAAAIFVRPVAYYLPIPLALGLFLVLARIPNLRWKAPAVLLLSVLPWLAAWQVRNWAETGYSGFCSAKEVNLYFQIAAGVSSVVEHRPFDEVRQELGYSDFANNSGQIYLFPEYLKWHPEQAGWSQGQRLAFMRSAAGSVIRAHKGIYLRIGLVSLFRTLTIPGQVSFDQLLYPGSPSQVPSSSYADQRRLTVTPVWHGIRKTVELAVFAVVLLGVYGLTVLGVFRGGRRNACLWLLLGTGLYFLAVAGAGAEPGGNQRYRLPAMPIICIFAAVGALRPKPIEQ